MKTQEGLSFFINATNNTFNIDTLTLQFTGDARKEQIEPQVQFLKIIIQDDELISYNNNNNYPPPDQAMNETKEVI